MGAEDDLPEIHDFLGRREREQAGREARPAAFDEDEAPLDPCGPAGPPTLYLPSRALQAFQRLVSLVRMRSNASLLPTIHASKASMVRMESSS